MVIAGSKTVFALNAGTNIRGAALTEHLIRGISAVVDPGVFRGANVLIKPNLCGPGSPDHLYSMTDPEVISGLAVLSRQWQAQSITVADHCAGYVEDPDRFFSVLGIPELARRKGFDFADLRKVPFTRTEGFLLSSVLDGKTVILNTTLPKTHHQAVLSLGTKSLAMGLLDNRDSLHYDTDLSESVATASGIIGRGRTIINVLDGRRGQDELGPHFGREIDPGFMLFGTNSVEVDSAAARLAGFDPQQIPMLAAGARRGLGSLEPTVIGDSVRPFPFTPSPDWKFAMIGFGFTAVYWRQSPELAILHLYALDTLNQRFDLKRPFDLEVPADISIEEIEEFLLGEQGYIRTEIFGLK